MTNWQMKRVVVTGLGSITPLGNNLQEYWDKLLKGRSARIITTSDAPYFYNVLAYWSAPYILIKKVILKFCGFNPVRLTAVGGVKNLSEGKRKKYLEKVSKLGNRGV